ncbi:anion permease [bacterium]|nr:anion permease [candidate division CSSED10-310 bacterium]
MWRIIGGIYMGWSLGTNDAANVFGTGVATKVVSFRLAALLMAMFIILGAWFEGPKCMELMKDLGCLTMDPAFWATIVAAVTMTIMSILAIPSSTSQAILGGIIGAGLATSQPIPDPRLLGKIIICWLGTPIGACIIAFVLTALLERTQNHLFRSASSFKVFITAGLIMAGCYGSYSIGANNVANTTGVYYACGMLSAKTASLIGGLAMALGAVTFGKRVMDTVGHKIADVGPLGALVAVLAESLTIHFYTQIGVPVSSSQAIVGAVMGVGLTKGSSGVYRAQLVEIFIGWIATPVIAFVLAWLVCSIVV